MIFPEYDMNRNLLKHYMWELDYLAYRLKKHMMDNNIQARRLVEERMVSAASLETFLNGSRQVDIATLIVLTQYLGLNLYLDFRYPSNRSLRSMVYIVSAKDTDIVRSINTAFRKLMRNKTAKEIARDSCLSLSTVYNFTQSVPEKQLEIKQVTVPDLLSVFKCARGCGYETYLGLGMDQSPSRCAA